MPGHNWRGLTHELAHVSWVGAQELMKVFRMGTVQGVKTKAGGEIALEADENASAAIARAWTTFLPGIKRMDEEDSSTHALLAEGGVVGIVDPLDGTGLFQRDTVLPKYAPVSGWGNTVCLCDAGVVRVAIIHQIALRQLFYAIEGEGCWWVTGTDYDAYWETGDLPEGVRFQIAEVSPPDDGVQALVLGVPSASKMNETSFDKWMTVRWKMWEFQLLGNELAAGCAVANTINVLFGKSGYVNIGGGVAWDLAAAGLCVTEAGGWASTTDGKPLVWDKLKLPILYVRDEVTAKRLLAVLE